MGVGTYLHRINLQLYLQSRYNVNVKIKTQSNAEFYMSLIALPLLFNITLLGMHENPDKTSMK